MLQSKRYIINCYSILGSSHQPRTKSFQTLQNLIGSWWSLHIRKTLENKILNPVLQVFRHHSPVFRQAPSYKSFVFHEDLVWESPKFPKPQFLSVMMITLWLYIFIRKSLHKFRHAYRMLYYSSRWCQLYISHWMKEKPRTSTQLFCIAIQGERKDNTACGTDLSFLVALSAGKLW